MRPLFQSKRARWKNVRYTQSPLLLATFCPETRNCSQIHQMGYLAIFCGICSYLVSNNVLGRHFFGSVWVTVPILKIRFTLTYVYSGTITTLHNRILEGCLGLFTCLCIIILGAKRPLVYCFLALNIRLLFHSRPFTKMGRSLGLNCSRPIEHEIAYKLFLRDLVPMITGNERSLATSNGTRYI